jgi:hypothetical protein
LFGNTASGDLRLRRQSYPEWIVPKALAFLWYVSLIRLGLEGSLGALHVKKGLANEGVADSGSFMQDVLSHLLIEDTVTELATGGRQLLQGARSLMAEFHEQMAIGRSCEVEIETFGEPVGGFENGNLAKHGGVYANPRVDP